MGKEFSLGRSRKQAYENVHLGLALVVLTLSVITVFTYSKAMYMFPVCFFAATVMEVCGGISSLVRDDKNRKAYGVALFRFVMAVLFAALGVVAVIAL